MATKVCFTSAAARDSFKAAHPEVQYVGDIEYLDYTKSPPAAYSWCTHYTGMLTGTAGPPATSQPPPSPTIAKPYVPPVTPAPAVTEATPQFWVGKGYTQAQATKIAEWVDKNKATPTIAYANVIAGIMVTPTAPAVAPALAPSPKPAPMPTPAAPTETALRKAWTDLQQKPDIIKAFGLLPSAVIESFSRVFSNWSYIDDKAADPRPGDYVGVGSIIAGAALAAVAGGIAAIGGLPGVGAAAASRGAQTSLSRFITVEKNPITLGKAIDNVMTNWGRGVAVAKTESAAINYIVTSEGVFTTAVGGLPGKAVVVWQAIKAMPIQWKLASALSGAFLLTQLDATGWFFGLSPEASHNKLSKLLGSVRSDLIRLDQLVKDKKWDEGKEVLAAVKTQLAEIEPLLGTLPVKFWEFFGFSFADKKAMMDAMATNIKTYETQYPRLTGLMPKLQEDVVISNVKVMDGDTIEWPGHPEFNSSARFAGMDAHESGTTSGKLEKEYLQSLIEGRTITMKINTLEPAELYGRLLGVPFMDGVNVVHLMLAKFGKDILGTKYKHKFVDWNENTAIAKGTAAPTAPAGMVPQVEIKPVFKIYIDSVPTRAKLSIDGVYTYHTTPSDEKELKDELATLTPGPHVFSATKAGWAVEQSIDIVEGDNGKILLTLLQVGLPKK